MRELPSRGRSSLAETDSATNAPASSIFQTTPPAPGGQLTTANPLVRVFVGKQGWGWPFSPDAIAKGATDPSQAMQATVVGLREALTREWRDDNYLVSYEGRARGPHRKSRLRTAAAGTAAAPVCVLLALDVDVPAAKAEDRACTAAERAALDARVGPFRAAHPGVIAYHTRGGLRLLALLAHPLAIDGAEAAVRWKGLVSRWIARAERAGLHADPTCVDWTRFFRLPHVCRDGEMQRWPWHGSPEELGCWPELDDSPAALAEDLATLLAVPELAVLAKHLAPPREKRAPRAPKADAPRSERVVQPLPEPLADEALAALAQRVAEGLDALSSGRHNARLALVGALAEHLPEVQVTALAGEVVRLRGRGTVAEWSVTNTYARIAEGESVLGASELRACGAYALAAIADEFAAGSRAARWAYALWRTGIPPLHTADDACAELARVVDDAVAARAAVIARLTPGVGKSRTTGERAAAVMASGGRAMVLARDHANADELLARLRAGGVPALGLRGLLSVRDASGAPACQLPPEAARGIEGAGVSVRRDLCDGEGYRERRKGPRLPVVQPPRSSDAPCTYRAGCEAYGAHQREREALAAEGPGVLVTVHAYAHRAHQWLRARPEGSPGLAVVDEDPDLFDGARITPEELLADANELAAANPYATDPATSEWLVPLVRAVGEWARDEALPEGEARTSLAEDLATRAPAVLALARAKARTKTGRLRRLRLGRHLRTAVVTPGALTREGEGRLQALQRAAAVVRAVCDEGARSALADERGVGRALSIAWVDEGLRALLADPTIARVVLDATALLADPTRAKGMQGGWLDAWLPGARAVTIAAADAREGTVVRIAVPWAHATRRHCLPAGRPAWAEVARPLAEGLRLAAEGLPRGSRVLVMTWKALADALRARAVEAGDGPEGLARAALDALDARGITVECTHYGALRGRDVWRDADAYLALGTPFPPPAQLRAIAAAARWGSRPEDVFGLAEHLARAELAQAVGRARLPRRATAARVVVVASALPADADARWEVRAFAQGRPRALDAADLASVAGLSDREAAAVLGVGRSTVQRARKARAQGGGPKRVTEREVLPSSEFRATPRGAPQPPETAGESGVPAANEAQAARLTIAEAEAQAAYEDAEVAAGGWQGLAPPARVVPELALACAAEGAPLALRWADPPVLAVPVALSPATAAEVHREAAPLALLLARRSPEDSAHEWPADERESYRERVAILTAEGTPDHLAERAAAWWVWAGPWPERAAPYARARGAA